MREPDGKLWSFWVRTAKGWETLEHYGPSREEAARDMKKFGWDWRVDVESGVEVKTW